MATDSMSESKAAVNYLAPNPVGGRPKCSTSAQSCELSDKIKLILEEAAAEYMIEKSTGKRYGSKAKRGSLTTLANLMKYKHSVPPHVNVSIETDKTRSQRGRLVTIKGNISPLAEVEEYIVDMSTQMAKMKKPISHRKGLELDNSLIDGTNVQDKFISWRKRLHQKE